MVAPALAAAMGLKTTSVRMKCYEMGLKKMELEYWTPVQVKWLKKLYPFIGDLELAQIFSEAYPKEKGWTLKHIEKKRKYLGLKRTKEQIDAIRERNKAFGCFAVGLLHTWEKRGVSEKGTVRIWNGREHIKTDDGYVTLARYTWEQHKGPIPKGCNVALKNRAVTAGDIDNLECLSNEELARRNSYHRYPLELKQAIRALNKLNKRIHEKQNF